MQNATQHTHSKMQTASILKKSSGFTPLKTYTKNRELYVTAAAAYASMAGNLERNGAPRCITPASFKDQPAGAFEKMTEAYTAMVSYSSNSPFISVVLSECTDSYKQDPVFWANTIVMQSLYVRSKRDSQGRDRALILGIYRLLMAAEAEPMGTDIAHVSRISFRGVDSEREFIASEPMFDGDWEWFKPTHDFDGPRPDSVVLECLLVDKSDHENFRIYSSNGLCAIGINKFLRSKPTAECIETTIATLRSTIEQLKTGKYVLLYPSMVKLTGSRINTVSYIFTQLVAVAKTRLVLK